MSAVKSETRNLAFHHKRPWFSPWKFTYVCVLSLSCIYTCTHTHTPYCHSPFVFILSPLLKYDCWTKIFTKIPFHFEGRNHWGQRAKLRGSLQKRYQPGREPKNNSKQDGAPPSPHHLDPGLWSPLGLHCCSFWYHLIVWEFFLFLILLFSWLEGFRQL